MKYIKKYELFSVGHDVEYSVGDIVVCTETKLDRLLMKNDAEWLKNPLLEEGKKYKILKLYKTLEDKFLNKKFLRVDVEDIETGKITKGWESTLFKTELEFDMGKYNL